MRLLGLFSLLPSAAGMVGLWKRPVQREPAARIAIGVIFGLVAFAILVDGYLLSLIL